MRDGLRPDAAEKPLARTLQGGRRPRRSAGFDVGRDGVVNLALQLFTRCEDPPIVMFSSGGPTAPTGARTPTERGGDRRVRRQPGDLGPARGRAPQLAVVRATSTRWPWKGLSASSLKVRPPRVAASPVHLECRYCAPSHRGGLARGGFAMGWALVGLHIRDEAIVEGRVDPSASTPSPASATASMRLGDVFIRAARIGALPPWLTLFDLSDRSHRHGSGRGLGRRWDGLARPGQGRHLRANEQRVERAADELGSAAGGARDHFDAGDRGTARVSSRQAVPRYGGST